jgi:ATP-dependent protease ClpP protease subunit
VGNHCPGVRAGLNAINASAIDLHINSGGGDVFDGLAIYQAIKDHPRE